MSDYAIGDVQGCHAALERLIAKLDFDPGRDRLWFTGDLVNRGAGSLETLRLVRSLGDRAVCVLGNHDLHLLALDAGIAQPKRRDTLQAILEAPDRRELLDWLRYRPAAVYDAGYLMVHAGVPPQWDVDATMARAAELEAILRSASYGQFLGHMYGNEPARWDETLSGTPRLRFIVNALTRLRFCSASGELQLDSKGAPGSQPDGLLPWFRVPGRATANTAVIFGHWSTLGPVADTGVYALDTGCVWGGALTAMPLDRPAERISVPCQESQPVSEGS